MSAPLVSNLAVAAGGVTAVAINALWEDALLVVCVWLLLRAWPGLNAATRYMVWSATLIATVVVPVATTLPFLVPSSPATAMHDTAVRAPMPMVTHALTAAPAAAANAAAHLSHAARPAETTPERSAPAPLRLPERFRMTLPLPLAIAVLAAWILLALVCLVRLAIGLVRLEKLKRDALPLPVEYRDAMARWTAANKGSREVRLCVSDEIDVPVAVGLFDSMILIPRALLERLSQAEVDQISLHELAHLRRADDWSNGFQRLVLALFAWNPGVLFVGQQLDLEREVACDDCVLALTGLVRPYALCLTKMAETSSWPHRPMPAPGVFATRRHISLRIERLLGAGRNAATNLALGPAAATIAIVAALAFAMQLVAPSVAASSAELPMTSASHHIASASVPTPHAAAPHAAMPHAQAAHVTERSNAAPAQRVAAAPAASAAPPSTHAHPLPAVVHVPATHVHLPASTVALPAVNVDVPAIDVPIARSAQAGAVAAAGTAAGAAAGAAMSHVRVGLGAMQIAQSSSARACTGCNFSGVDWSGRDLRNVRYVGTDLTRAKLQGTNFDGGVFNGVDFTGANLRSASFRNARLVGCDFSHADLSGADFTGASLSGCQFTGAQLPSAQLRVVLDACTGCDFAHANLSGADLSNVRAATIDFSHANLSGANLSGARFVGTDFSNADLRGANLNGTELNACDLSGVDLTHVDLSRAKLIGTNLDGGKPRI